MESVAGRRVLVTGAGRGTGRVIALALARQGAAVALMARDRAQLESVAAEAGAFGVKTAVVPADVADESQVASAVDLAAGELGGLDVVVHNAGIGINGPIESYSLDNWNRVISTNLTGVFLVTRAALPHLKAAGYGDILAIASGAAKQGYPNLSAYCSSKFGLIGFMQSLAAEVGPLGIRASTILPGSILTGFGSADIESKRQSGRKYVQTEDVAEGVLYLLRQPRHAWTQEMNLWPF